MLKLARSMQELPFRQLMAVYRQSNIRTAQQRWGEYSPERGLIMAEEAFYEELNGSFFAVPNVVYCLWMVDGDCVSALRLEPWTDGWLLAGLETAPQRRKQGHARALLTAVQEHLKERGTVQLYSHIHIRNTASIHVHEQCGFCRISDTARLLDGTITTQMSTYLYQDNTTVVH